ncbi:MAG: lipase family protein [Thermoanaerobaculia bacterium]
MQIERITAAPASPPFPIYSDATEELLRAHSTGTAERDPAVAHILGVLSGYAYADTATMAVMASRLGFGESFCIRVAQTVDAMLIFSTAYLLQSRCGRVAILCYRGTEPANLGNWFGDADVGSQTIDAAGERLIVHAGFYRNVRATRWPVLELLHAAARGQSLADVSARTAHPLEALYITGHSLGGAMAVLFALGLADHEEHRILHDKLRAVYTFGQPLVAGVPAPEIAAAAGRKLFRHVLGRDIIPSLPPSVWGSLQHFGHEFHYADGQWQRRDGTVQLAGFREASRATLAVLAPARKRDAQRYTMADHGPHQYIAALRPAGRVTEFGDRG